MGAAASVAEKQSPGFTPITFNQVCEVVDIERKLPRDCSDLDGHDAESMKREVIRLRGLLHAVDGDTLKSLAHKLEKVLPPSPRTKGRASIAAHPSTLRNLLKDGSSAGDDGNAEVRELQSMEKFNHLNSLDEALEAVQDGDMDIFSCKYFYLWIADHFPQDIDELKKWLTHAYFSTVLVSTMKSTLAKANEVEFSSAMYEMVQLFEKFSTTETGKDWVKMTDWDGALKSMAEWLHRSQSMFAERTINHVDEEVAGTDTTSRDNDIFHTSSAQAHVLVSKLVEELQRSESKQSINDERAAAEGKVKAWIASGGSHGVIHGLVEEKVNDALVHAVAYEVLYQKRKMYSFDERKGILVPMFTFLASVTCENPYFAKCMYHGIRLLSDLSSKRHDEVQEIIHDVEMGEKTLHALLLWSEANEKYFGSLGLKDKVAKSHIADRSKSVKTASGKWNVDPAGKTKCIKVRCAPNVSAKMVSKVYRDTILDEYKEHTDERGVLWIEVIVDEKKFGWVPTRSKPKPRGIVLLKKGKKDKDGCWEF